MEFLVFGIIFSDDANEIYRLKRLQESRSLKFKMIELYHGGKMCEAMVGKE